MKIKLKNESSFKKLKLSTQRSNNKTGIIKSTTHREEKLN